MGSNRDARKVGFSNVQALTAYVQADQVLISMTQANLAYGDDAFANRVWADHQWLEAQTDLMAQALATN